MIRPSWIEMLVSSRIRVIAPLAAVAGAAGLTRASAQTPASTESEDAADLLTRAIARMQDLQSYEFELEVSNGEIEVIPEVFSIQELDGEVVRPDSFSAEADVEVLFVDIDLKIVTIGDESWITNPLVLVGADNEMIRVGDLDVDANFNPAYAVNPDRIALPLLGVIENPVLGGQDADDGVTLTRVDGTISKTGIESLGSEFGDANISDAIADSFTSVMASVWIDDDDLVHRFDITGQIFAQENDDLTRSFTFDEFDRPIVIARP